MRVRSLALREGTLALHWERPDEVLVARIEGLEGGGRGRWDGEDGAIQAEVKLEGRTVAPLEGPARVALNSLRWRPAVGGKAGERGLGHGCYAAAVTGGRITSLSGCR